MDEEDHVLTGIWGDNVWISDILTSSETCSFLTHTEH